MVKRFVPFVFVTVTSTTPGAWAFQLAEFAIPSDSLADIPRPIDGPSPAPRVLLPGFRQCSNNVSSPACQF